MCLFPAIRLLDDFFGFGSGSVFEKKKKIGNRRFFCQIMQRFLTPVHNIVAGVPRGNDLASDHCNIFTTEIV